MLLELARCLEDPDALLQELQQHRRRGALLGLALPEERQALMAAVCGSAGPVAAMPWGEGPALVLGSGGSRGSRRWCLQPLLHLQRSADACAEWLSALGIDPSACLHLAALPLHHVSGLMPLIRVERWSAELRWLPPAWMRQSARRRWSASASETRTVLPRRSPTAPWTRYPSASACA